jgi:hypothetical protein
MSFKRMDGYMGSIPQKFIDNKVPKCPMCGTTTPHWLIDQKFTWTVTRYLFKCVECECILSSPVPDVTGFSKTILTNAGLFKLLEGKKLKTIYFKIDTVGKMQATQIHEGKEVGLEELVEMANQI